MYGDDDDDKVQDPICQSTRDLGGEPLHDQNGSLDQRQSELNHHRYAEATRAYARQGQSDDPYHGADDGQEEREEREGKAQEEPERPAFAALVVATAATAAHDWPAFSSTTLVKFVVSGSKLSLGSSRKSVGGVLLVRLRL